MRGTYAIVFIAMSVAFHTASASTAEAPAATVNTINPMPPTITSRYFRASDGARLHWLEAMPAAAGRHIPVIVLVPGWSMPASIWHAQLASLGQRYRVIAFDPRGQGQSAIPRSGYNISRRARDLHELISRHRRVVLVGWSLGALETLQYVHLHGDARLAALVLVDSSVGEGQATAGGGFQAALRRDRRGTLTDFINAIFKSPRTQEDQDALIESALRMPLAASLALFPSKVPRTRWRNTARRFAKPLLYVVTPQFAEQAHELASNRPATQIEIFENAGHALFVDEPERFNALLAEFVADHLAQVKPQPRRRNR